MHRRLVHAARASPCRVREFCGARCARDVPASGRTACCERRASAASARAYVVRTRRTCRRAGSLRSATGGERLRRAAFRAPGMLQAACVRCWRTRRLCVHMPRVSPGRVLVFGWRQCDDVTRPGCCEWRRRPPLLAHAPLACARGARIAVKGACAPQKAVLASWRQAVLAAASYAPLLLAHAPVACAFSARVASQGACGPRPEGCSRDVPAGVRLSWLL